MIKKQTQIEYVKEQLICHKQITRNQCLAAYISRLGAIIYTLKQRGWVIEGYHKYEISGKNYAYRLIALPQQFNNSTRRLP